MADDEIARQERAKALREEIERLRSGDGSEEPPQSPRDFVEKAGREETDREGADSQGVGSDEES